MNRFSLLNNKLRIAATALAGILLLPAAAAQQAGPKPGMSPSPGANTMQQEFMQQRAKLQQLQQQLGKIQKQTMDKHPDLQQRQEDFRDLMFSKMEEKGHSPKQEIGHLKTLQTKLQDKDIKADKRKDLIQDYRKTNMSLQQAQQEALQDKEVKQARQSLSNDVLSAMRDEDPHTDKLLQQVKETRQSLIQMQQRAAAQSRGNGPGKSY